MGRSGRSRRPAERLRAEKTAATNAVDYIPPTFILVPSPTTERLKDQKARRTAAADAADYIPTTFTSIASPTRLTQPPITTPRTPSPYGGAAVAAPALSPTGNSAITPYTPRTPRPYAGTATSTPSAPQSQPQPEASQSATTPNSHPSKNSTTSLTSAGAASTASPDSYVYSAVRWGSDLPLSSPSSPSLNYDFVPKCPNNLTGKNLTGANPFLAPRSNPIGRGLRRQTASRNLSNASKASLSSAGSDREAAAQTARVEALLKDQRELLHDQRNIYVNTVPQAHGAPETLFNPKAWRTEKPGLNEYPKSAPPRPAPPLPHGRAQAWHKTHELPPKDKKPAMPRDGEEADEGALAVETFEELEKSGKKEVPVELVREIVDYFEDKLEELTIKLCDDRGKIAEVNRMVQKIDKVEKTNVFYRKLLELKTVEEGQRDKLQDGVDLLALAELEVEVEQLREENAEMKENYELLEGDHKIATESVGLDKELLEWHEEEERKKDKRIKELEGKLEEREKEITFAGFTSRPKLRKSPSGDLLGDGHSRTSSDSGNIDDSSSGRTSTMSNSSKDSSVSSAKANIHLLEMQYHHSRGQYSLAAAAGATAEKYLDASSDPKTSLAIKALRASTLAVRSDSEGGDIEAARRLFEDAIFLAQSMSGERRKKGKEWEDKCHAWLLHLADVEAKRRVSAAGSAFQSRGTSLEPARENKNCASPTTVPASASGEGGIQAMHDRAISMSAPHKPIHGPVLSTPAIPGWLGEELEAANCH